MARGSADVTKRDRTRAVADDVANKTLRTPGAENKTRKRGPRADSGVARHASVRDMLFAELLPMMNDCRCHAHIYVHSLRHGAVLYSLSSSLPSPLSLLFLSQPCHIHMNACRVKSRYVPRRGESFHVVTEENAPCATVRRAVRRKRWRRRQNQREVGTERALRRRGMSVMASQQAEG